jgi:hypothetical protein
MKNEGDPEPGYCLKMVSERGERYLLLFNVAVVGDM